MAIAKGTETKDFSFKRFIGIGNVNVVAVNPTKAELAKLGRNVEEEPQYVTVKDDGTITAKVSLYVRPIEQPDEIFTMNFFIRNSRFASPTKGTFQVIDSYGRTAWVTEEQLAKHEIPIYKGDKPANIASNYRAAFLGENALTQCLKAYLVISDLTIYDKDNEKWVPNPKATPADCEVRFDHIDKWFKGDFKEVKEAFAMQPNNTVQALFGVRTDDQNRQSQTYFSDKFYKGIKDTNGTYRADAFAKELDKINSNPATSSRYANTEFEFCPLKEYAPTATNFEQEETKENPWD